MRTLHLNRYGIYIIILIALAIRLYNINSPIIGYHSWRQADTAAIARNFHEHGYHLLYPQIDWGGNSDGYVETEFQIYPYAVALLYGAFGTKEFLGRLLSLIFSLVTIYALYLLVRRHIDERTALWACTIYSIIPLSIYYSRAFMPESALIMCSVLGIYLFSRWIESGRWLHFLFSAMFVALAGLIKIPTLYLGLPLFYISWLKFRKRTVYQWSLWLYALLVFAPVALWYYHAHQIFIKYGLTFGIWGYGVDKWGNWRLLLTVNFYNSIFFKSIAERHLTWGGFVIFVTGLFIRREDREERLFDFWLISLLAYFVIVTYGNQRHEYYQLPFVVVAVVFVGKSLSKYIDWNSFKGSSVPKRLLIGFMAFCLICIPVLSSYRYIKYMKAERRDSPTLSLAEEVQKRTEENALIVAVEDGDPTVLYLSHRKGWNGRAQMMDSLSVSKKREQGARYVVGETVYFKKISQEWRIGELLRSYSPVISTDDYFIIELR